MATEALNILILRLPKVVSVKECIIILIVNIYVNVDPFFSCGVYYLSWLPDIYVNGYRSFQQIHF